ncbi:MAG: helix-turn-helix transcriptional regulator [Thermodesulfobacteriota bacterium]
MSIKYAVLGLLHYQDMYGYRIKDHIEKNFGFMWTVNFGQIYSSLKALAQDGLITLKDVLPSEKGAPHKKVYSITEKGRKDFGNWLRSSPEKQLLLRDPFILRFIFFGFGDEAEALSLVEEQIGLYENLLSRRNRNLSRWKNQGPFVVMAAELGVGFNEMHLQWLYRVRDYLTDKKQGPIRKRKVRPLDSGGRLLKRTGEKQKIAEKRSIDLSAGGVK